MLAGLLVAGCAKPPPPTTPVYEFYNALLNRYFRTANAEEAAALRANPSSGEVDTGKTFLAYPRTGYPEKARPVCRFYGSVSPGPNSHFYTADPIECDKLKELQQTTPSTEKRWNFEEIAFAMQVPAGESCPADAPVPIYRVYNKGFEKGKDSNHRLTTDPALYQSMISQGWDGEKVVMCAPKG
jgi:lysyl endopeptidase